MAKLLSVEEEWTNFKSKHNRNYPSPEEEANRFKIFKDNYQSVKEHNEKFERGEETFTKAINQFSDQTSEEFNQSCGLKPRGHMMGMAAPH